jgi:hypothetical protein
LGQPGKIAAEIWNDDPAERRRMLFPFLRGVVAKKGQIFGNQNRGSIARATNAMAFSYAEFAQAQQSTAR